jgi:hypothetical protein
LGGIITISPLSKIGPKRNQKPKFQVTLGVSSDPLLWVTKTISIFNAGPSRLIYFDCHENGYYRSQTAPQISLIIRMVDETCSIILKSVKLGNILY